MLALLGVPREMVVLPAGIGTAAAITLVWKISVHVAVVAGIVSILSLVFGPVMLALAPVVVLSAWARVVLRDHTPAQTAAGAFLGSGVASAVYSLLR